jgi:hypothetical protein
MKSRFQPAFFIASVTNSAQSVTNASPNQAFVTKSSQSVTNVIPDNQFVTNSVQTVTNVLMQRSAREWSVFSAREGEM